MLFFTGLDTVMSRPMVININFKYDKQHIVK